MHYLILPVVIFFNLTIIIKNIDLKAKKNIFSHFLFNNCKEIFYYICLRTVFDVAYGGNPSEVKVIPHIESTVDSSVVLI